MNQNEKGFGVPLILLAVLVLTALGAVGWFVYRRTLKGDNTATKADMYISTYEECVTQTG